MDSQVSRLEVNQDIQYLIAQPDLILQRLTCSPLQAPCMAEYHHSNHVMLTGGLEHGETKVVNAIVSAEILTIKLVRRHQAEQTRPTAGHLMQLTRYQEIPCFATCISLVINFNCKVLASLYMITLHKMCARGVHTIGLCIIVT